MWNVSVLPLLYLILSGILVIIISRKLLMKTTSSIFVSRQINFTTNTTSNFTNDTCVYQASIRSTQLWLNHISWLAYTIPLNLIRPILHICVAERERRRMVPHSSRKPQPLFICLAHVFVINSRGQSWSNTDVKASVGRILHRLIATVDLYCQDSSNR